MTLKLKDLPDLEDSYLFEQKPDSIDRKYKKFDDSKKVK